MKHCFMKQHLMQMTHLNRLKKTAKVPLLVGRMVTSIIVISMTLSSATQAQGATFKLYEDDGVGPAIRDLNWLNNTFLNKQRNRIDAITRSNFGRPIRKNKSDIIALQRTIDEELIDTEDTETLQALGVVLGDVYINENNIFEWKVYEDGNASHAICIKKSEVCLFPITMLSRRIEAGTKPNVDAIYKKGLKLIEPHLPRKPFDGRPEVIPHK